MPTPTYEPIANTTLSSNTGTVTFSSIPQTYKDIFVVVNGQATGGAQIRVRFNGDSSSVYQYCSLRATASNGTGTQVWSNQNGLLWDWAASSADGEVSVGTIFDYSATDKHKMVLNKTGNWYAVGLQGHRWASNAAINSITFYSDGQSLVSGSTFAIYGLAG